MHDALPAIVDNFFGCMGLAGIETGGKGLERPSSSFIIALMTPAGAVTAFVLAGGKSRRMGTDKAFVMLEGRTLLARALLLCRTVTETIRIVGDRKKFAPFAPVVEDVVPGCGPLGGIHAALRASRTDLNVVLAVDLPFVSPALLQFLIAQARDSTALVTVPRVGGGWQPVCAVYRAGFGELADKALREGRCKIDALFGAAQTLVVEESNLRAAGFSPEMFRNLNTPEELAEAQLLNHRDIEGPARLPVSSSETSKG